MRLLYFCWRFAADGISTKSLTRTRPEGNLPIDRSLDGRGAVLPRVTCGTFNNEDTFSDALEKEMTGQIVSDREVLSSEVTWSLIAARQRSVTCSMQEPLITR